ncbi:hypothetical protein [Hoeflea sp. AS16]|uniref:hypothetical protein n=1 Tax=Hoeflea sp. AS16 TaxID=3135779 RepID=UPI003175BA2E
MHHDRSARPTGGSPFRDEHPGRALRDEDRFMQAHGGASARAIYLAVSWIEASLVAAARSPALVVRHVNRRLKSHDRRHDSAPAAKLSHPNKGE